MWIEQQYEESIEYIGKAIKLDDLNPEYWLTLGKVNKDFNNKTQAYFALKKAAQLEPENSETWLTWADAYLKFKEPDNAIRILKKGIEENNDVILKYRLVAVLIQNKKLKKALEIIEIAMEQDFSQIDYLYTIYPKSVKNKRLIKLIANFKETKKLD